MTDLNITEKVQTHAYYLWKEAGEPQGEEMKFWLMAENSTHAPKGFIGRIVVVEYEGCELHVRTESATETDCHGVVVNEIDHLGIGIGDEIVFTPEEVIGTL